MTVAVAENLGQASSFEHTGTRQSNRTANWSRIARDASYAERVWWQMAIFLLAGTPLVLLALIVDTRLHNEIPIWVKPLKFQVSMALHLITLAVLVRMLKDQTRHASWLTALAVSSSLAALIEMLLIAGQAARGVSSHFNYATPLDGIIYAIMGVGSLILILPALVVGFRFLAAKPSDRMPISMKYASASGLLLSFILTLVIAGYMSTQGGHWVEAPATDADGLPVVGWSRGGGDLRVAHFFATHIMQVVPTIGALSGYVFALRPFRGLMLVAFSAIGMSALTIGTFLQALNGEAFI
ncbi:MAG: hypothetical protein AAF583_08830 [Pseudomonadota bacterium]